MSRNAALNPASVPFFPGGNAFGDDDLPAGMAYGRREQDPANSRAFAPNPQPEYRTFQSSPSPTADVHDRSRTRADSNNFTRMTPDGNDSRSSPAIRQVRADRGFPGIEMRAREMSLAGSVESMPEEGSDTLGPMMAGNNGMRPRTGSSSLREPFLGGLLSRSRESLGHPHSLANPSSRSPSFHPSQGPILSASPVSSIDSASQAASSGDNTHTFDAQLQSSPLIRDILDRLVHCEYSTSQIQRDLGDVNRKIDLLLERALAPNSGAPEFKDPFSPSNMMGNMGPRASFNAPIAPNQQAPPNDMNAINQRLNTLTNSMSHLLALQTQGLQSANNSPLSVTSGMSPRPDMSPNNAFPPSTPLFVTRGISRNAGAQTPAQNPNPPLPSRSWSAVNLEIPSRPSDTGSPSAFGRQESLLRDKQRRSVMGLVRRDSIGVCHHFPVIINAQYLRYNSSHKIAGPRPQHRLDLQRVRMGMARLLPSGINCPWHRSSCSPSLGSGKAHSVSTPETSHSTLFIFSVGPPNKIQQRALPFLLRGADIIAQAPPTQERIAAYVIPAIQVVLSNINNSRPMTRGPIVVMVSTTVDQATQAQRMIRDLGGPIGVRSALGVGATSGDIGQELRLLQQNVPHIICGTPQKLHAIFTSQGGLSGAEVRFLVLDEVDQLIARNLHEFVFNIVKLFPPARSRPANAPGHTPQSSVESIGSAPFGTPSRKFSGLLASPESATENLPDRQTALFSNTVPQDVLNLATQIQLREPVRVLVRRDGTVTQADTTQGARGLRQFYLYLALPAGGRPDPLAGGVNGGLGIIGSGRGATSTETSQAREWKLDALADLFDAEIQQAIIHVGGMAALDAVVYKLASKNVDAVPLVSHL